MDIINILPDSVANQIAAGEVVDRPAGAVKELLENAMDAGATQIDLILKDAGRTLIQVIDNGCGMSDSDARLCFERHATSKIHRADDLFAIHTMGFRGEALASIAAIAQVELHTRMVGNELGTAVVVEGSRIVSQHPEACPTGTSMAVKNLFYNVPARRNFLKKDSVELSHIEEAFRRIALIHYDIGFRLQSGGRTLYDLGAGSMLQRICQMYGNHYRERFYAVEEATDVVHIKGFVGKPEYSRKTRTEQYLFVNGRFIKHPALNAAIEKAYADMLPDRGHPSYFVSLQVDPSRIDINIHPSKTEVRFIDDTVLFSLLCSAVKKALGVFTLATELEFSPSADLDFSPAPRGYVPPQPRISYNPAYNPFERPMPHVGGAVAPQLDLELSALHGGEAGDDLPAGTPPPEPPAAPPRRAADCLQVQGRYIVTPLVSGLAIIDQQRAYERVLFDRMSRAADSPAPSQTLLFPATCRFSAADADLFAELLPDLSALGFGIEAMGGCSYAVNATPAGIRENELQDFFDGMLAEYKNASLAKHNLRSDNLRASVARQMAVRHGDTLTQDEMQQLVADLFACPMAETTPSGKKVITIINPKELL